MKRLAQLKQNFEKITNSKMPTKIKKQFLQGVLAELKLLSSLLKQQSDPSCLSNLKFEQTSTNFTGLSHLSLNSNDLSVNSHILPVSVEQETSRQELQAKILQKQRIKIMLNDQIQNYEDDYFHFQKILLTKKEYNEDLDNQITKHTYQISKKSCQKSAMIVPQQEKKSLSYRFKNFFLL